VQDCTGGGGRKGRWGEREREEEQDRGSGSKMGILAHGLQISRAVTHARLASATDKTDPL